MRCSKWLIFPPYNGCGRVVSRWQAVPFLLVHNEPVFATSKQSQWHLHTCKHTWGGVSWWGQLVKMRSKPWTELEAGITTAWIGDYLLRANTDSYYSDISEALERYNAEAVHWLSLGSSRLHYKRLVQAHYRMGMFVCFLNVLRLSCDTADSAATVKL